MQASKYERRYEQIKVIWIIEYEVTSYKIIRYVRSNFVWIPSNEEILLIKTLE